EPSGRLPTTSVKVPPRSIQKSQRCGEVFCDAVLAGMTQAVDARPHYVQPVGDKTSLLGSGAKGNHKTMPLGRNAMKLRRRQFLQLAGAAAAQPAASHFAWADNY